MTLLSVRDLSVRFATEDTPVQAVDRVSFDLESGEVMAIVGESGCGKSVLALALLGLMPPTGLVTGSVILDGRELVGRPSNELRQIRGRDIGMVFQEPVTSLNPVYTVGRQISEVLRRHQRLPASTARTRAIELLHDVGIPGPARRINDYPHQLSGGMAQRVMIAMAIACGPRILIADEPTTALDVTVQAGILRLLLDLRDRNGMAVLLITHDLGVVAEAADRVMVMYAGRRVESATVDDLFSKPQHPYAFGLLGAVRHPGDVGRGLRRLQEIRGTVPVRNELAASCVFAPRCPRADERCRSELPADTIVRSGHLVACFHPGPGLQR
jgi:peptide/nickel transport system ATP-binding protein